MKRTSLFVTGVVGLSLLLTVLPAGVTTPLYSFPLKASHEGGHGQFDANQDLSSRSRSFSNLEQPTTCHSEPQREIWGRRLPFATPDPCRVPAGRGVTTDIAAERNDPYKTILATASPSLAFPAENGFQAVALAFGSNSWREYSDPVYGFSISIPSSWRIVSATEDRPGSVTQFSSFDPTPLGRGSAFPGGGVRVEVGVFNRDKPTDVSLEDWSAPDSSAVKSLVAQSRVQLAGHEALRQDFADEVQSGSLFLIPDGSKVYFIAVMPLAALDDGDISQALASFRIVQTFGRSQLQATRLYPSAPASITPDALAPSGYRLPFVGWHYITNGPGCTDHIGYMAEAIDFDMPSGTSVYAAQTGQIVYATFALGFGNLVKIQHNDGNVSYYAHLDSFVRTSGGVHIGDLIAYSDSTGNSTAPHLHFEVRNGANQSIWIRDLPGITWYSGDPYNPCQLLGNPDGYAVGPPIVPLTPKAYLPLVQR